MRKTILPMLVAAILPAFCFAELADAAANPQLFRLVGGEKRGHALKHTCRGVAVDYSELREPPYIELAFAAGSVKLHDRFDKAKCMITLNDGGSPLQSVALRLIDAKKEIFQYRGRLTAGKGGAVCVEFDITPENFAVAFSGNKDRRMDFPVRLHSTLLGLRKQKPLSGNVTVESVRFDTTLKSELCDVTVDADTGDPIHLVLPGNEKNLFWSFRNPGDREIRARALIRTALPRGGECIEEHELVIAPHETLRLKCRVPLDSYGVYRAVIRLESEDRDNFAEKRTQFARIVPARFRRAAAGEFLFGINTHSPLVREAADREREAYAAMMCGAQIVRFPLRWWAIEPRPGVWDFQRFDDSVAAFAKYGIEVQAIFMSPPKWGMDPETKLPDFEKFAEYIHRGFEHCKGKIRYFEVINEPDLKSFGGSYSAGEYIELQKIVRRIQKQVAPEAVLLTGGFATARPHGGKKEGFQEYVLEHSQDNFDVHAFHEHGGFRPYADALDNILLPMRRRLGVTAPIYANETAISSLGIGERSQAAVLYKKLLYTFALGGMGYTWYDLRNDGFAADNPEHNYGLITRDYKPKEAFCTFNMLTSLFRGKRFVQREAISRDVYLLAFAGDGDICVAAWKEIGPNQGEENVFFRTDAAEAYLCDLAGNADSLKINAGVVPIKLSASPHTLLLKRATRADYIGSLVKAEVPEVVIPGEKGEMILTVQNPFRRRLQLRFEPRLPDGTAIGKQVSLELQGEETQTETLVFAVPAGIPAESLNLVWSRTGQEQENILRIPLRRIVAISPSGTAARPDFLLDRREQVTALFDADPVNSYRLWNGPEDLSARIGLACIDSTLIIEAEVTDDRHCQKNSGEKIWQGDSIQVGLSIPSQSGMWILGAALNEKGNSETYLWEAPAGFDRKRTMMSLDAEVTRSGTVTRYRVAVPLAAVGITETVCREGFRFNLLVNDNDGYGRESWMGIADGIAAARSDVAWPLVMIQPAR
ncbi:hypothetical protein [Victivallis vadensis]|uniref:hypothetical protein n=1 Tax=Victivallis vadensis TaxID=172901 RepID=UPI00266B8D54|nr:hypothetical protein [Victivallis vadensis]